MSQTSKIVTVGLIQMSMTTDMQSNIKKGIAWVEKAAQAGAKIICLPELFSTHYFPCEEARDSFDLAEPMNGSTVQAMQSLAKRLEIVIIVPIFEKRASGLFHNSAAVIDADGEVLGTYRKMHIPDDPHFYEKYYFAPGDLGFKTFKTRYANIGVLICWDQWYPEAARLTALSGAEIIFYPTAIGWLPTEAQAQATLQLNAWKTIQVSHAIANGVYVASANRVGQEAVTKFWGNSFITNPESKILAQANQDEENILIAECDLERVNSFRQEWPFLRDRRIDAYSDIQSRFID